MTLCHRDSEYLLRIGLKQIQAFIAAFKKISEDSFKSDYQYDMGEYTLLSEFPVLESCLMQDEPERKACF